jgi:hypothetical protein
MYVICVRESAGHVRMYAREHDRASSHYVDCFWNVMSHAQKPDFVFRRKGRVHLNQQGRQFSRLLAGELCTSARRVFTARASLVLQSCDAYWLPTPISCYPFTSRPLRHRVPSHFQRSLPYSRGSAEVCPAHDLLNEINGTVSVQMSSSGKSVSFEIQYLVYLRSCRNSHSSSSAIFKLHVFWIREGFLSLETSAEFYVSLTVRPCIMLQIKPTWCTIYS